MCTLLQERHQLALPMCVVVGSNPLFISILAVSCLTASQSLWFAALVAHRTTEIEALVCRLVLFVLKSEHSQHSSELSGMLIASTVMATWQGFSSIREPCKEKIKRKWVAAHPFENGQGVGKRSVVCPGGTRASERASPLALPPNAGGAAAVQKHGCLSPPLKHLDPSTLTHLDPP